MTKFIRSGTPSIVIKFLLGSSGQLGDVGFNTFDVKEYAVHSMKDFEWSPRLILKTIDHLIIGFSDSNPVIINDQTYKVRMPNKPKNIKILTNKILSYLIEKHGR